MGCRRPAQVPPTLSAQGAEERCASEPVCPAETQSQPQSRTKSSRWNDRKTYRPLVSGPAGCEGMQNKVGRMRTDANPKQMSITGYLFCSSQALLFGHLRIFESQTRYVWRPSGAPIPRKIPILTSEENERKGTNLKRDRTSWSKTLTSEYDPPLLV